LAGLLSERHERGYLRGRTVQSVPKDELRAPQAPQGSLSQSATRGTDGPLVAAGR
jgi:hypothetical protein